MAKVEKQTVKVPVTTYKDEDQFVLTLTPDEASVLLAVAGRGSASRQSEGDKILSSIYQKLHQSGIPSIYSVSAESDIICVANRSVIRRLMY